MRQLSRYFGLPIRIIAGLFLIAFSSLVFKYFIYEGIISGHFDLIIIPGIILVFVLTSGCYITINLCDVSTDNEYIYAESLLVKEKIPIKNIQTFYIDFKGFNIVFKEPTKFGKKIFFAHNYFEKNQTKKLLQDLIIRNRALAKKD
jgi:hypothetical protein